MRACSLSSITLACLCAPALFDLFCGRRCCRGVVLQRGPAACVVLVSLSLARSRPCCRGVLPQRSRAAALVAFRIIEHTWHRNGRAARKRARAARRLGTAPASRPRLAQALLNAHHATRGGGMGPPAADGPPKPSWRWKRCFRPDGKGWVSYRWQKQRSKCRMAKKDVFDTNLEPANVSVSARQAAASNA